MRKKKKNLVIHPFGHTASEKKGDQEILQSYWIFTSLQFGLPRMRSVPEKKVKFIYNGFVPDDDPIFAASFKELQFNGAMDPLFNDLMTNHMIDEYEGHSVTDTIMNKQIPLTFAWIYWVYGSKELASIRRILSRFAAIQYNVSKERKYGQIVYDKKVKPIITAIQEERYKMWMKNWEKCCKKYPEDKTQQDHQKNIEDANIKAGIYLYIYYVFFILALKLYNI